VCDGIEEYQDEENQNYCKLMKTCGVNQRAVFPLDAKSNLECKPCPEGKTNLNKHRETTCQKDASNQSSSSSSGSNTVVIAGAAAGALVLIVALFVGYKCMSTDRKGIGKEPSREFDNPLYSGKMDTSGLDLDAPLYANNMAMDDGPDDNYDANGGDDGQETSGYMDVEAGGSSTSGYMDVEAGVAFDGDLPGEEDV
jgi:hypothetical protein